MPLADKKPLIGLRVYVDVRSSDGKVNYTECVSEQLILLGAKVLSTLSNTATHVVFKNGKSSSVTRANRLGITLVNVLWVESCREAALHLPESDFPVTDLDPDTPVILKRARPRFKSLQPSTLAKDTARSDEKLRRKLSKSKPTFISSSSDTDTFINIPKKLTWPPDHSDILCSQDIAIHREIESDMKHVRQLNSEKFVDTSLSSSSTPPVLQTPRNKTDNFILKEDKSRTMPKGGSVREEEPDSVVSMMSSYNATQHFNELGTTVDDVIRKIKVDDDSVPGFYPSSESDPDIFLSPRKKTCILTDSQTINMKTVFEFDELDQKKNDEVKTKRRKRKSSKLKSDQKVQEKAAEKGEKKILLRRKLVSESGPSNDVNSQSPVNMAQTVDDSDMLVYKGTCDVNSDVITNLEILNDSPKKIQELNVLNHLKSSTVNTSSKKRSTKSHKIICKKLPDLPKETSENRRRSSRIRTQSILLKSDDYDMGGFSSLSEQSNSTEAGQSTPLSTNHLFFSDTKLPKNADLNTAAKKSQERELFILPKTAEPTTLTDSKELKHSSLKDTAQDSTESKCISVKEPTKESKRLSSRDSTHESKRLNDSTLDSTSTSIKDSTIESKRSSAKDANQLPRRTSMRKTIQEALITSSSDNPLKTRRVSKRKDVRSSVPADLKSTKKPCAQKRERPRKSSDKSGDEKLECQSECANKTLKESPKLRKTPKMVVCTTSCHKEDQILIVSTVRALTPGVIMGTDITDATTHVVVGVPRRTINLLKAIAYGCFVVNINWVTESISSDKWLPEDKYCLTEEYQILKEDGCERKLKARKLFGSIGTIFIDSKTTPPRDKLVDLVTLCGGQVTQSKTRSSVIVGGSVSTAVMEVWILDSISELKLKSVDQYLSYPYHSPSPDF